MIKTIPSDELRRLIKRSHLLQSEIAQGIGLSQGQVSRLIAGKSKKQSQAYQDLCIYVLNNAPQVENPEIGANLEIMEAIAAVWDGTPEQATAIARVVRSLGYLCKRDI